MLDVWRDRERGGGDGRRGTAVIGWRISADGRSQTGQEMDEDDLAMNEWLVRMMDSHGGRGRGRGKDVTKMK